MADKKTRVLFTSQKSEGRPINVYKEHTSEGDFLWYTTEDGREVGRERIEETDVHTQRKRLTGYDFSAEYSASKAAEVKKLAFPRTKFYHKDGQHREMVKPEAF